MAWMSSWRLARQGRTRSCRALLVELMSPAAFMEAHDLRMSHAGAWREGLPDKIPRGWSMRVAHMCIVLTRVGLRGGIP